MTVSLTLPEPTVEVVPGHATSVAALLRNDGDQPQRVRLDVGGRAAPWLRVADRPDEASEGWLLGAGERLTVTLLVSPPGGAAVPGQLVPFTVRATSSASSRPSGTATGLVLIRAPVPVTAALVPAGSSAPGAPSHVVELSTDDPAGVLVTLRAAATSPGATVTVEPVAVRVQPGSPARADVVVRPRRPALWGPRQHPFDVVWETEAADGLARGWLTGRVEQPAFLPKAVTLLLLLGLVAVLGLGVAVLSPFGGPSDSTDGAQPRAGASVQPSSSGGQGRPDGVAVVVDTEPQTADLAASRRDAEERAAELVRPPGTTTEVLDARDVPGYEPGFWLLVVGGFPDVDAARAFCDRPEAPAGCTVLQRS